MLDINVKTIDGQSRSFSVPENVRERILLRYSELEIKIIPTYVCVVLVHGEAV